MSVKAPLPYPLRGTSFRVSDARFRGVSPGRLRAQDLERPFHGIRTTRPPTTQEERARALAQRLRPDQALSHSSAAAVLGVPLPRRLERDPTVHVTTIGTDQALRVRGAVGHRADPRTTVVYSDRVAVTSPADTFVALGTLLTVDELVVAGDFLVGRDGRTDIAALRAAVTRHAGGRGLRTVRAALADVRVGSRSPGETRTRLALVRRGLPEPELNHDVVVGGRWLACVDLAYPEQRVAIEYESDLHRTDDRTFRKDLTRGEVLKDADWWCSA